MKKFELSDFSRGWIIGDFEPSLFRTSNFEVALLSHAKGESWPAHFHSVATEFNVLVKGKMIIQKQELKEGDVFVIEPGEIADPIFLEDCKVLCVKVPSAPGDKHEIL